MHPFTHPQHTCSTSKTTIFDIASNIVECVEQAENKYFLKDSTTPSKFSQVGGLLRSLESYWELPIEPRDGVFVNPVKFLRILKDVLKSKSEKVFEGFDDSCEVTIGIEKINLRIWNKIQHENHIYSLKIESEEFGIIEVVIKQTHTCSLKEKIEMKLKAKSALEKKKS